MTIPATSPWQVLPWFMHEPPALANTVDRPRVRALLDTAVAVSPIAIVSAPSGFGKTVAVAEWAAEQPHVVWVSGTSTADTAVLICGGLLSSLPPSRRNMILSRESDDPPVDIFEVLDPTSAPLVIVIDDAHLLDSPTVRALLLSETLLRSGQARIVLAGHPMLEREYAREIASGAAELVSTDQLRFTHTEATQFLERSAPDLQTEAAAVLIRHAEGWPIALRLGANGRKSDGLPYGGATMQNYIATTVIDTLPDELADLILATAICDRFDVALARALTANPAAESLLHDCVQSGLFLSTYARSSGETVYRWHDAFAAHCRELLRQRDPQRALALHRTAADELIGSFPAEAIRHALAAHEPELAASLISRSWLRLILESHTETLNRLCVALPEKWRDSPEIQHIRACCCDLQGETHAAALLRKHAISPRDEPTTSSSEFAQSFAELLLAASPEQKSHAAERAHAALASSQGAADHPHALFVLGWAELRLRRDPELAIAMLADASSEAARHGYSELENHARLNALFARTYGGHFSEAEAELAAVAEAGISSSDWDGYDGGLMSFSRAYIEYWRGDFASAVNTCDATIAEGGTDTSFIGLARVYSVLSVSAGRCTQRFDAAERTILEIPPHDKNAVPWGAYRRMAAARLAEARGDFGRAREIGDPLLNHEGIPVTHALLADMYRRLDQPGLAHIALKKIAPRACPRYARVSALVTLSGLHQAQGSLDAAHRAFSRAVGLAVGEEVMAPFLALDDTLAELIDTEARYGGEHEPFLARIIARRDGLHNGPTHSALSPREHELLAYLRTPMTAEEIARELHLSLATVKTHLRNLYRKLGVNSRRDAIRRTASG